MCVCFGSRTFCFVGDFMRASSIITNCDNSKKRIDSIQILRGLAIIAVVIIHSYPQGLFGVFLRPFVNFAVAMFIFLSGYLTKVSISDYRGFVFKRIKRVFVPYCIWSVVYTIPTGFDGFLIKFITGRCCGIYYYIFVYMQLVVLTPLIIKLIKSKYQMFGWLITPFFTLLFRYIFVWLGFDVVSSNFNYLFVAWFVFYYVGILLGNDIITLKNNNRLYVILYVICIALSICEGLAWYKVGNYDMATTQLRITSIATSMVVIVLAYHFIKNYKGLSKNIIGKVLLLVGDASFGIYLSHILIMVALSLIPVWKYIIFPVNSIVILSVSVICVLIGKKVLSRFAWLLGL